jgi:hypothetical protein
MGQYGRMFGNLPPLDKPRREHLEALLEAVHRAQAERPPDEPSSGIPAGYTYFGQFIAHDVTYNPMTDLTQRADPEAIVDFRTPRLDLDSLYGRGPAESTYFYDPVGSGKLAIGWGMGRGEDDLPRRDGDPAVALIGDPRNDETTMISQLHLAFIKLHNELLDGAEGDFAQAQRLTCWHYQWVVLNDYLGRVCDREVLKRIWPAPERRDGEKPKLRWYNWKHFPFVPLEFAGAAFRFGHSMVRDSYALNFMHAAPLPVFGPGSVGNLRGFNRLPPMWTIQWEYFLNFNDRPQKGSRLPQEAFRIDLTLAPSLTTLPPQAIGGEGTRNLTDRNIDRGYQLELPSGQAVARAIGEEPIKRLWDESEDPLWVYVLREAQAQQDGERLGKVGSTIVAETIIGLVAGDPLSYLNVHPKWKPTLPGGENFELRDLIRAAKMPITEADLQRDGGFSGKFSSKGFDVAADRSVQHAPAILAEIRRR